MDRFGHINAWVFDLDDTLYTAPWVGPRQVERILDFLEKELRLPRAEAAALREKKIAEYGTSLRWLMTERGVAPGPFMAYIHDFDISPIPVSPGLREKILLLPGRRFVFSNSAHIWTDRVLPHLGLADCFERVFAIEDSGYMPKPQEAAYRAFLEKTGVDPRAACMFEDSQKNLAPARALGMTTVWLHAEAETLPHVQYRTADLAAWLTSYLEGKTP